MSLSLQQQALAHTPHNLLLGSHLLSMPHNMLLGVQQNTHACSPPWPTLSLRIPKVREHYSGLGGLGQRLLLHYLHVRC
jgi:hypothetical protein